MKQFLREKKLGTPQVVPNCLKPQIQNCSLKYYFLAWRRASEILTVTQKWTKKIIYDFQRFGMMQNLQGWEFTHLFSEPIARFLQKT